MASDRLTVSDKRALLLWVLLGIVGVVFAQKYFFRAFPEASVDFRVSRSEALQRARSFLGGFGDDVSGYRSAVAFDVDENAKTYLEREVGVQQANRLMSSELDIWYWDVRFFRPQQEEEFRVRVSPSGKIAGYEHKIEEARAGASLDRASAQTAAQNFLSAKLGVDLNAWDFLPEEANSNQRPNRLDWSFTWEKHGFRAKDAPYRMAVTLHGDRVDGSEDYLQVPEAWERAFKRMRSGNDSLALVFTVPYLLLLGAAVWLGIKLSQRGQTSWRGAILLGLVVTALLFLQNLNNWPLWGSQLRHQQFLRQFFGDEDCRGAAALGIDGDYGDAGAARGGAAVSGIAAGALAAFANVDAAGIAVEGVFFRGGGGVVDGRGAHRVRSGVLRGSQPFWGLGAAGIELRGVREHGFPVDIGSGHRTAGFDERRVYVSLVCDSLLRADHPVSLGGGGGAGVFVELSAQQLSAGARLHSRD